MTESLNTTTHPIEGADTDLAAGVPLPAPNFTALTPLMYAELHERIRARGNPDPIALFREVLKHEGKHRKLGVGLTEQAVKTIMGAKSLQIEAAHWQRLNETLDELPIVDPFSQASSDETRNTRRKKISLEVRNPHDNKPGIRVVTAADGRVEITSELLKDLKTEIAERGGYAADRLLTYVRMYEEEQKLPPVNLSRDTIKEILESRRRTTGAAQWDRLAATIEWLPVLDLKISDRIDIDPEEWTALKEEIAKRGAFGKSRLMLAVVDYETKHKKRSTGLTEGVIGGILDDRVLQVNRTQWQRLKEVIAELPLVDKAAETVRIKIDAKQLGEFKTKLRQRGLGKQRLMMAIIDYEKANQKPSTGLTSVITERIINGRIRTIAAEQWQRLNEVIDALPVTEPDLQPPAPADSGAPVNGTPLTPHFEELVAALAAAVTEQLKRKSPPEENGETGPQATPAPAPASDKFAGFKAPAFTKKDAVGDSMLSVLTNAERAFFADDPVGLKSNLRKFAELFIHHTLLSLDGSRLEALELPGRHFVKARQIIRDYLHTCASIEVSDSGNRQPVKRGSNQLKLLDMRIALINLFDILTVSKGKEFPAQVISMVRQIMYAAGEIHVQIRNVENASNAQILQNGFDLAKWFEARFGEPAEDSVQNPNVAELIEGAVREHLRSQGPGASKPEPG